MRNAAAELLRLIRPDENGDGVENVRFKLSDCAFVKLFDDGDLETELAGAKFD